MKGISRWNPLNLSREPTSWQNILVVVDLLYRIPATQHVYKYPYTASLSIPEGCLLLGVPVLPEGCLLLGVPVLPEGCLLLGVPVLTEGCLLLSVPVLPEGCLLLGVPVLPEVCLLQSVLSYLKAVSC